MAGTVVVRIPEQIRAQAKVVAALRGITWQEALRCAVDDYIENPRVKCGGHTPGDG